MSSQTTKPSFRFGMIAAGMIFLCNPNLNLFDILPDFIGYLLIALALSYAAEAFPHFEETRQCAFRLMWLSLSKLPAALIMVFIWGNDNSQGSIITVFSLCYSILELMFLLPLVGEFFEGIFYMGQRHDCPAALSVPESFGKIDCEKFRKLTVAFFITKVAMSTLPELSLISVRQYNPDMVFSGSRVVVSALYPQFLAVGAAIVLIFGVIWITMMTKYLRFLRNAGTPDALLAEYFADKADYLEKKRHTQCISMALLLMIVGIGFSINLVLDDLNILPNVLSMAIFFVGIRLIKKDFRYTKPAMYLSLATGAVSLFAYILYGIFIEKFELRQLATNEKAVAMYDRYLIVHAVETVLTVGVALLLTLLLSDVMRHYHRKEVEMPKAGQLSKKSKQGLVLFGALGMLTPIATFAFAISNRFNEAVSVEGSGSLLVIPQWDWFWMVPLFLSLSWLVFAIFFVGDVRDVVRDTIDD